MWSLHTFSAKTLCTVCCPHKLWELWELKMNLKCVKKPTLIFVQLASKDSYGNFGWAWRCNFKGYISARFVWFPFYSFSFLSLIGPSNYYRGSSWGEEERCVWRSDFWGLTPPPPPPPPPSNTGMQSVFTICGDMLHHFARSLQYGTVYRRPPSKVM